MLLAPNHIDLAIPFYAALYNGVVIAAVDRTLSIRKSILCISNCFKELKKKYFRVIDILKSLPGFRLKIFHNGKQ